MAVHPKDYADCIKSAEPCDGINHHYEKGEVFYEVECERQRQDTIWGGPIHDDTHTQSDWVKFIETRLFVLQIDKDITYKYARKMYIEIAALCVAAIESLDREEQLAHQFTENIDD